jgi:hypothetical protein
MNVAAETVELLKPCIVTPRGPEWPLCQCSINFEVLEHGTPAYVNPEGLYVCTECAQHCTECVDQDCCHPRYACPLTREEAAYAHLASFQRGDVVDVGGRAFFLPGTVTTAQQDASRITSAYVMVTGTATGPDGNGGWRPEPVDVKVTVVSLLSGKHTITSRDDAKAGNVRYFDPAGYAAQNPEAEHFHAVSDPASWSCEYAHPYATEAQAMEYAEAVNAAGDCGSVTVVPCRNTA